MNKEKFIVEYDLKSVSPTLLWSYIGTKNGLADWFADDVQNEEKLFTFFWNKSSPLYRIYSPKLYFEYMQLL